MILTKVKDLEIYSQIIPIAKKIIELDFEGKKPGTYDIDGESFYEIYDGPLRQHNTFENHKKYIEVQIPLDNDEGYEVALHQYRLIKPYDEKNDISRGYVESNRSLCIVEPGEAIIFLPGEPHSPIIHVSNEKHIRKVCVKIPFKKPITKK